eukprot:GHVH01012285.1.p1 GENE.GHVH01012285.1~~GHVH01012285.1.p1  ORF type:complete len:136 (+),score=19.07 GHVH01012285.1:40-447(+)
MSTTSRIEVGMDVIEPILDDVLTTGIEDLVSHRLNRYKEIITLPQVKWAADKIIDQTFPEASSASKIDPSAPFLRPVELSNESQLGLILDSSSFMERLMNVSIETTMDVLDDRDRSEKVNLMIKAVLNIANDALK